MKSPTRNWEGFTLIEMATAIILLGVLVGFSFQLLTGGIDAYLVGRDYTDISQQGKIALEKMAREARFAIQSTVAIGTNSISFTKFTASPMDPGKEITFHLVDGINILRRTSDAAGTNDLADNVLSFDPAFDDQTYYLITLDLTLTRGDGSVRYRTIVYPRN